MHADSWPEFRCLRWPLLITGAVLHVASKTVDLAAHHLMWEPSRARRD